MKKQWKYKADRVFDKPALRHSITDELVIFGKLGNIYPAASSNEFVVVLTDLALLKKHCKQFFPKRHKFVEGDEYQFTVNAAKFKEYYSLIRPVAPIDQLKLAS